MSDSAAPQATQPCGAVVPTAEPPTVRFLAAEGGAVTPIAAGVSRDVRPSAGAQAQGGAGIPIRRRQVLKAAVFVAAGGLTASAFSLRGEAVESAAPRLAPPAVTPTSSTETVRARVGGLLRGAAAAYAVDDQERWAEAFSSPTDGRAGGAPSAEPASLVTWLDPREEYRRMRLAGVQGLSYDVLEADGPSVRVRTSYRFGGFDTADASFEGQWRLGPGGATVVALGREAEAPWQVGGDIMTASDCLVLSGADPVGAEQVIPLVREALTAVSAVWGAAPVRPVVVIPADGAGYVAMTRGPGVPGDPAASAATTLGAVVGGRAVGCDRVYLDPGTWVDLTPEGRRVVLAHEFTHLAVRRDVDGGRPAWLDEGFCEFVAYRDCPLTPAEIAADLVRDVRERGLPAALPVDEEFTSERAQLAYRAGWLACLELAAHVGDDGLARLVALASDGRLEAGLAHLLGWGLGDLTVAWRSRLARLAGVPA